MRKVTVYCLLLAAALTLYDCSPKKKSRSEPPVPVVTAVAVRKTIPVQIEAVGTVEAFRTISLKSRVTESIRKILFKEGQDVKKGKLLVLLDTRAKKAALEQAEATLAKDRALARYAKEQSRRYSELIEKDYVARDQYDQVRANAESLAAVVKADEAAVENTRLEIGYCSIYSPIDGRIGKVSVDEGNIVMADNTEIAVINQITPVEVSFAVPEKALPEIKKFFSKGSLGVEASIPGSDAPPEKGELTFVDNAIDKTTGTITLKGTFANQDKRLWPGQYVDVVLNLTTESDVVVVPSESIEQGPDGKYVYVVKKDQTVEMRPVVSGRAYEGFTVIADGVREGEQVVTDGQLRLTPGAKVSIR
ncbi:MAG TPA: efflux RND transporter periplasmic adaptor subunit [Deltaproteobacteria bacterium]|jgi:multidrug efflux system membrane fusion protein|nr:efflux RND transporter periplasmic adaptor subunit [Deltaproteobacteria bacterium]HQI00676.1 efflux RND transporter periplasmic adaptor subunit [Deltaproteobacteria bacterium]